MSRSIRIAWAMPTLARSFYYQPFFRALAQRFPDSVIYTGLWPGYADGYEGTFAVADMPGVRHVKYGADPLGYGRTVLWVPPTFLLTLRRFRPDVIIVGGFNVSLLYAGIMRWLTGAKVVLFWDGNAPYASFDATTARGRLRRWLGRAIDAAVSNTVDGARYLREAVGVPADRVSTIVFQLADKAALTARPVDLGPLATAPRPLLLYVGRLVPGKAVHHLLTAAGMLRDRGLAFTLCIIGSGPEDERLRRQARDLRLDDRVHWMGERPYGELGTFFAACDIFVLPSLLEVRPMVVSEAMCFGKPVVVTKHADLAEIVIDGDNGFVFDPHEPAELAARLEQLMTTPGLAAACGARSAAIIAPYTPESSADRVKAILEALVVPKAGG